MSLLSSILLPRLEKELIALEPDIAEFLIKQLKNLAEEVIEWSEKKVGVDMNGDGLIGDDKEESNG